VQEKIERVDYANNLIKWYRKNKRDLPWRRTDAPYKIWVSEVMLQQTRVETVIPYYARFLNRFPTIHDLATAHLQDVLKIWEGLGYYARARNLHSAAQHIVDKHDGQFPQNYDDLLAVKGIGAYTAAALASIAFNHNHAVVDGNVKRVLARIFKIEKELSSPEMKAELNQYANHLLKRGEAGDFNQAMMELGATICLPKKPDCANCPVKIFCAALKELPAPDELPVRRVRKPIPHYDIAVGIIRNNGRVLIDQQPENKLLGGLWKFPGGKLEKEETLKECLRREILNEFGVEINIQNSFMKVKHAYTHFRVTLHVFLCNYISGKAKPKTSTACKWVSLKEMQKYPTPKSNQVILQSLLEQN